MNSVYTKAQIETKAKGKNDFVAVASTPKVDRHGEDIVQEGWDLKAFEKNPVLLWAHKHDEPAVGVATKVWIEGKGKRAKLMIEGRFHEYTDRARAVKQMVRDGIIKTMSVGFQPIEMEGDSFTKQELHEVSFVNVPANSQAMVSAVKSLRKAGIDDEVINELGIPTAVLDDLATLREDVDNLKSVVKVQPSINPQRKTEERLSMLKVIAKASDTMLVANKSQGKVDRRKLVKVIKKATESMIVAEKRNLNGKN